MTARTIVGLCTLVAILGTAVYLLLQIPWEYGVGGIVVLAGLWLAIRVDEPDAL
jgi:hypothetical protein